MNASPRPSARDGFRTIRTGASSSNTRATNLPYRTFDKVRQVDQAAIVENKRIGAVLAYVAERQKELGESRSKKAPRRGGQDKGIFK